MREVDAKDWRSSAGCCDSSRDSSTLSTRVRLLIKRLLFEGDCTHLRVASLLSLHPRSLQRRLKLEGNTFVSIRDSVRRDLALFHLQQMDTTLVELTWLLGYAEPSVLSRSCMRWFAMSPKDLRRHPLRQSQGVGGSVLGA